MPRKKSARNSGVHQKRKKPGTRGSIWTGSISFGLVSIPVTLRPADASHDLSFTMLDKRDMAPVGYKKINKATGEEVAKDEIVKGYEYRKGEFVIVTEEDFKRAAPEKTQRIDIVAFVDLGDIPPTFFEKPYYLEPTMRSHKAYALLREAMQRTKKVGIANVVIKAKQNLAALVPYENGLVLELLRYTQELRDPSNLDLPPRDIHKLKVTESELKMAERLIEDMAAKWEPEKFRDEYHDALIEFIEKKAEKGKVEAAPEVETRPAFTPPSDIMHLLKQSLERESPKHRLH